MPDVRIGGAYIDFFGRTIRFQNATRRNVEAIRRQQRAIRELRGTVSAYNRTVETMTRRLTIAASVGFALASREIAHFTQTLATVRAISGATETQFQALTAQAIDLGRRTRFTATQAAEGQLFLARAGFRVGEIFKVLPGTLQLAQAAVVDVGRSADIVSNILLAFNASVEDTPRFVDVLTKATNTANTNLEQLAQALKFSGTLASTLGVDIEQASAAVSVLSDAGLQASIAGTGLRQIFADLTNLSGPATEALARLGLTAQDVSIQSSSLLDVIQLITDAGATATDIFNIFDVRAATAFVTLQANIDRLREQEQVLRGASGAAAELARIQDNTLTGAYLRASSAVRGFSLRLNEISGASDRAQELLDSFAQTVNSFTDRLDQNLPRINYAVRLLFTSLLTSRVIAPAARALRNMTIQFGYLRAAIVATTVAVRALGKALLVLTLFETLTFAIDFIRELRNEVERLEISFKSVFVVAIASLIEGLISFRLKLPELVGKVVITIADFMATSFLTIGFATARAFNIGFLSGEGENAGIFNLLNSIGRAVRSLITTIQETIQDLLALLRPVIDFFNEIDRRARELVGRPPLHEPGELFGSPADTTEAVGTALDRAFAEIQRNYTAFFERTKTLFSEPGPLASLVNEIDLVTPLTAAFNIDPAEADKASEALRNSFRRALESFNTRYKELVEGGAEIPPVEIPVEASTEQVVRDLSNIQIRTRPIEIAPLELVNIERQAEPVFEVVTRLTEAGRGLLSTFEGFFDSMIRQTRSVGDAFRQLGRELLALVARYLVIRPLLAQFINIQRTPFLFNAEAGFRFFQSGGIASGLSVVGERGPELVDFRTPARVYSAGDTAGLLGGSTHVFAPQINGAANADELVATMRERLFPEFVNLTRATMREEERRRG